MLVYLYVSARDAVVVSCVHVLDDRGRISVRKTRKRARPRM